MTSWPTRSQQRRAPRARAASRRSRRSRPKAFTARFPVGNCATTRTGLSANSSSATSARRCASFSQVGELAEAESHHPDISFGWGYATVSLQTKKIKGLHENDFIMAAKIDRLADNPKG